jgi:thermostable 8-oxoguanine DNA glycosylase
MAQEALGLISGKVRSLLLPAATEQLVSNVCWGHVDELFTPAYWAVQAWLDSETRKYSAFRLGNTLKEEVCACLLGGYGIPAEVGLAAYEAIKNEDLLSEVCPSETSIRSVLSLPLEVGGRLIRYRFAAQKASYLAEALRILSQNQLDVGCHRHFRNWLKENLPGVGWKTASWITRNFLDSDEVAILDIHILRAGRYVGLYDPGDSVDKCYLEMEERFLEFARALQIRPAVLDTLIWSQMKESGHLLQNASESTTSLSPTPHSVLADLSPRLSA